MLYTLIYLSKPTVPFSREDLETLESKARVNNESIGLTGLLLYTGEYFLQILEGEHEKLNSVFNRVAHDPRHDSIEILFGARTKARFFPAWTMGFIDDHSFEITELYGICNRAERHNNSAMEAAIESMKLFSYETVNGNAKEAA